MPKAEQGTCQRYVTHCRVTAQGSVVREASMIFDRARLNHLHMFQTEGRRKAVLVIMTTSRRGFHLSEIRDFQDELPQLFGPFMDDLTRPH